MLKRIDIDFYCSDGSGVTADAAVEDVYDYSDCLFTVFEAVDRKHRNSDVIPHQTIVSIKSKCKNISMGPEHSSGTIPSSDISSEIASRALPISRISLIQYIRQSIVA